MKMIGESQDGKDVTTRGILSSEVAFTIQIL